MGVRWRDQQRADSSHSTAGAVTITQSIRCASRSSLRKALDQAGREVFNPRENACRARRERLTRIL